MKFLETAAAAFGRKATDEMGNGDLNGSKMSMAAIFALFLLAAVLVIGVWDISMSAASRPDDTVSAILYGWSLSHPILPFAVGLIIGHVFWRN